MEPANEVYFGELLTCLRKRKRLTQQELANLIGVHRSTISFWERSLYKPETMTMLYELARVLDLNEEEKHHLFEAYGNIASMVPLYTIPTEHNPYFTGREEVLDLLHQKLKTGKNVALTQAISGLGGIGKTQVALEYTYRYQKHYHHIFWASAETDETLVASYTELARRLHLPEREEHDQNKVVEAVKRWLREHKNWLLVLDNIEDLSLIKRFLPIDRQGVVVLTTRRQVTEPVAQVIELDVLSEEVGALFLLRRIKRLELHESLDAASAEEVAVAQVVTQQLGGLPLALDQAGAYILETGCTPAVYLSLWQRRQSGLLRRRGCIPTEHPVSVTMTFILALEWVQYKNQAAIELLKLCAFLAPNAIVEDLFAQGDDIAKPLAPSVVADPLVFNDAIETLRSVSLVRWHPETHMLSMHRLVQAVVRQVMSEPEQEQWQQQATHLLHTVFPEVTYETWELCERLLPHVLMYATDIQDHTEDMERAGLLSKAALYLHQRAQYEQAQPLFERALRIREQGLGPEHPEVAGILNKLAAISYEQGKYKQAQPLYERALHIWEQRLGSEHPEVARVVYNLAMLYRHQGKYEQAQPLYERALHIWEQRLGPEHPNVAYSLNGLAALSVEQCNYEKAEHLYKRALHSREHALGPEHPETAQTLHDLATCFQKQGHLLQAASFFERALSVRSLALGDSHPKTVVSRTQYAQLLQRLECAEQERFSEQRINKNQDSSGNEQSMMESASISTSATANPFASDNDPLTTFLATCCELHPQAWSRANGLWQAYEHWVREYQERFPLSRRAFTTHLKAHGCQADRTNTTRIWRGIAIVNKEQ